MRTLTVRPLGVSYLIQGDQLGGGDLAELPRVLTEDLGEAVAPIAGDPETDGLDGILVDRRTVSWRGLLDGLGRALGGLNCPALSIVEAKVVGGLIATIEYRRVDTEHS